jgi:ribosomal protein L3 glutamine methyltransferase
MSSVAFPKSPPQSLATVDDWWRFALSSLNRAGARYGQGTSDATQDASFLVLGALSLPLDEFERFRGHRITDEERSFLFDCLRKRCVAHVPTAYILGFTEQCGVRFAVDQRVLIPRSYLGELVVNGLSPWLKDSDAQFSLLDLCTGSGCLAILAAYAFQNATVAASDVSPDALAVAAKNIADHDMSEDIRLREGDLLTPWGIEKFDVIVSNPPYVTEQSMNALPPEFLHEPALALQAGLDGCDILIRMLATAKRHLKAGGMLFVDVGHNRDLVEARFPKLPFNWLATEGAEDGVFMLSREDLPQ